MADTHSRGIVYTPSVPATLKLAGREIVVDEGPLASSAEERRSASVLADTPEEFVIGPTTGLLARRVLFAVGTVLLCAVPLFLLLWGEPVWVLAILAVIVVGLAAQLVQASLGRLCWLRFDRRAGRVVSERRAGFSRRRETNWELPLDAVLAVQLLYSGSHSITETMGADDRQTTSTRQFFGYEINLVLDDPARRRMHLLSLADWAWIRETGNRLAAFLGVPVIDKLHHGS